MLVVALTGNAGSGKSTLAEMLVKHGATRLDTDQINRQIINSTPFLAKWINETLNVNILTPEGSISTHLLRSVVFESEIQRAALESILHPVIMQNIELQREVILIQNYLLLEIPLLFETRTPYRNIDQILLITAEKSDLIQRISLRSGLTTTEAENILNTQLTDGDKFSISNAIVINNQDMNTLRQSAFSLHQYFLALSKAHI